MTATQRNDSTDPAATLETVPGRRLARALTGWIGASAVVGVATFVLGRAIVPASADPSKALTAITVFEVYVLLIGSLYLSLGFHGDLRNRLRVRFTSAGDLAMVVGIGALCWGAVVVVYLAIGALGALGDSLIWLGSDGGRLGSLDPVTTGLSLLRACLLAPIGEELLFRGALFGWLRGRAGAGPTILVSAALFGATHILPILIPVGFALGLGLGWVRERTGSVLPGIFFHIAHNTALFAVVYVLAGWH